MDVNRPLPTPILLEATAATLVGDVDVSDSPVACKGVRDTFLPVTRVSLCAVLVSWFVPSEALVAPSVWARDDGEEDLAEEGERNETGGSAWIVGEFLPKQHEQ